MLISVAGTPAVLLAAEIPTASSSVAESATAGTSELKTCFDYYRFGSVPVVIGSETVRVAQGGVLKLLGTVKNENTYPLDDVTVYAKVFYKKDFKKSSFGPDIVDWFVVAKGLALKPGESLPLSAVWQVPSDIKPGYYQIATYVTQHDRFNYAGLTFSNDVVGNLFNFSIAGQDLGSARFDNTKTVLNGQGFHAAIFPPRTPTQTEGVPLSAVIQNTMATPFQGVLHWTLYSWDGINDKNRIAESDEPVSIAASSSATVSYSITDTAHTVYFIEGELQQKKGGTAKSILAVRYIVSDASHPDRPRIAALGTKAYPGEKGTELFACVHSTGTRPSDDVRLELSSRPLDPLSWILNLGNLGKVSYKGPVSGAIVALAVPMTGASNNFAMTARLYQGGQLIDEVTSTYSCKAFSNSCPIFSGAEGIALLVILVALILGGLGYLFMRRFGHTQLKMKSFSKPSNL